MISLPRGTTALAARDLNAIGLRALHGDVRPCRQCRWKLFSPPPRWGVLGGMVLLAWCFLVIQYLLAWRFGSPYLMTFHRAA